VRHGRDHRDGQTGGKKSELHIDFEVMLEEGQMVIIGLVKECQLSLNGEMVQLCE